MKKSFEYSGYATCGHEVISYGLPTKPMIAGPHRHTSIGRVAESIMVPVSFEQADALVKKGYVDRT